MSVLSKNYTLNNGVEIPKLGLGTWFIDDADAADNRRQRRCGYGISVKSRGGKSSTIC